jgi:hypothetical protein
MRTTSSAPVFAALDLARAGVVDVFNYYGKDVRAVFDPVQKALERAVYVQDEDQHG